MRCWLFIFFLLLSFQIEALVKPFDNAISKERIRKSILEETYLIVTDVCSTKEQIKAVDFTCLVGEFSVFPAQDDKIPSNFPICIAGSYKQTDIVIELWDITDQKHAIYVKNLNLFYIYLPMPKLSIDKDGNWHMQKGESNKGLLRKYRQRSSLNPRLIPFRTYEIRIYELNKEFLPSKLLVKWKFYSLEKDSPIQPSPRPKKK